MMERLTERVTDEDIVVFQQCKNCFGACDYCEHQENANRKLKEYEDLEEQGLLLKLPCKVGDTIYYIDDYEIYWDKVYNIDIRKENEEYVFCVGYMDYKADDFGKAVFLTKEEAEAKLKELKNESV